MPPVNVKKVLKRISSFKIKRVGVLYTFRFMSLGNNAEIGWYVEVENINIFDFKICAYVRR
jgi:hypothetical protein